MLSMLVTWHKKKKSEARRYAPDTQVGQDNGRTNMTDYVKGTSLYKRHEDVGFKRTHTSH